MSAGIRPAFLGTVLAVMGWAFYVLSFTLPVALENGRPFGGVFAFFAAGLATAVFFRGILLDPGMMIVYLPMTIAWLGNLVMLLSPFTLAPGAKRNLRWIPWVLAALPPANLLGVVIIPGQLHNPPMVGFWVWESSYVFVAIGLFLRRCEAGPAPSLRPLTPRPWGA